MEYTNDTFSEGMADYFATNCIFLFFSQPTLNKKEKIQFEKDMLRMRLNCGIYEELK
jgi:hypothetical protein